MYVVTVERRNFTLIERNFQQNLAQSNQPSATTNWWFEKTKQNVQKRNRKTDTGLLMLMKSKKLLAGEGEHLADGSIVSVNGSLQDDVTAK